MLPHEDEIRDLLAERLEIIEPGLKLVKKNFPLVNRNGAKGFVDILARDSTGMLTVIELKRADSAAREAMHEIGKYIGLLAREKGIPLASLRAIVVSTTWHELLVPFSYYAGTVEFPLVGYQLILDSAGFVPQSAVEIQPLAPTYSRVLTEHQRQVHVPAESSYQQLWDELIENLGEVGVVDFAGMLLAHSHFGQCIILALGTLRTGLTSIEWATLLNDALGDSAYDADDLEYFDPEELALQRLDLTMVAETSFSDTMKSGSLVRNHGWERIAFLRHGVFEDTDLLSDESLVESFEGWTSAQRSSRYNGVALPKNALQWQEHVDGILGSLPEAHAWRAPVTFWLASVGESARHPVGAYIYDHGDLLQSFVSGWPGGELEEYLPELAIAVQDPNGRGTGLMGFLAWDGSAVDVFQAVAAAFPTPGDWAEARMDGDAHPNRLLQHSLHLEHVLFEKNAWEDSPRLVKLNEAGFERIERRTNFLGRDVYGSVRPFADFLDEYGSELDVVVSTLRGAIVVDDSIAAQLHLIDRRQSWPWQH